MERRSGYCASILVVPTLRFAACALGVHASHALLQRAIVQQLTFANSAEALQNTTRECPSGDLSIERVLGDRVPQRNAAICCRLCAASRCSRVCQARAFPNGNGNGDCIHTVASYEALGSSPLGAGALGHSSWLRESSDVNGVRCPVALVPCCPEVTVQLCEFVGSTTLFGLLQKRRPSTHGRYGECQYLPNFFETECSSDVFPI